MICKMFSVFIGLCIWVVQPLGAQGLVVFEETKGKETLRGLKEPDGTIVLKARYDQIAVLNDTLYKTFKQGKEGLFHQKYGEVYAAAFDKVVPYAKHVLFRLEKADEIGLGNYKGEMLLPLSKKNIIYTRKRVAYKGDTLDGVVYHTHLKDNSYGLYRSDGKALLPPVQKDIEGFSEDLCLFRDQEGKYKFLNIEGEVVFEAKYEEVKSFNRHGLAAVKCSAMDNGGRPAWGFINKKNERVLPCELGTTDPFYEDSVTYLIKIAGTDYARIYDVYQKKYLPFSFQDIDRLKGNLAPAKKQGRYGLINIKGEVVVPFIYSKIYESGKGWKVTKNHVVMELDLNGNEYFDSSAVLTPFEATPNGGKFGFKNKAGDIVIEPELSKTYGGDLSKYGFQIYEDQRQDHYYFIGSRLHAVVEKYYLPSVSTIRDSMRYLPVRADGKLRLFSKKELKIIPGQEFDDIKYSARFRLTDIPFNSGMIPVKKNDLWGYIDIKGNQVVPFKYHSCYNFSGGRAAVSYDGLKWGFIDDKGTEVIPCKYKFLFFFEDKRPSVELVLNDTVYEIDKNNVVLSQKKYIKPTEYSSNNNYIKSEKTCSKCKGEGMVCEGGTTCTYCDGTGNPDYEVRCRSCGGDGWEKEQVNTNYRNSSTMQDYGTISSMRRTGRTCRACQGKGSIYYSYCNMCKGTGKRCNDRQRCSKCDGAGKVYE